MGKAIELREGFDAVWFRNQTRRSRNSHQARRLLSLAAIVEGKSRKEAAEIGGMDRQSLRDTYLSNRIFESYEAIVETCCKAWNRLIEIVSLGVV